MIVHYAVYIRRSDVSIYRSPANSIHRLRDLVYGAYLEKPKTCYNLCFTFSRETVHFIRPLGSDCGA